MGDLRVEDAAVTAFAAVAEAQSNVVGAECTATGPALGSGPVQDALGNVALVLTLLDQALAQGAGALARDARSTAQAWASTDSRMAVRAV